MRWLYLNVFAISLVLEVKLLSMEVVEELEKRPWWNYLEGDLQRLLTTSYFLLDVVKSWGADLPGGKKELHDFSFIVFPAAKAYEGFLKKLFLDLKFITEEDYYGKHFRIGKSLNPSLPREIRVHSVYTKIVHYCGGKKLADNLWETWRVCRNLTFHWFPNEKNITTLPEAGERLQMVVNSIDGAFKDCRIAA
jgi:hypothetical protein